MLRAMPGFGDETASPGGGSQAASSGWTGTVLETMDASTYTYVHLDTGKEKIWAAGPQCEVKVGDKVTIPDGAPMKNFTSKTLNRTFDTIYFVGSINTGAASQTPHPTAGDPHAGVRGAPHGAAPAVAVTPADFAGLKKAPGGMTVSEIFAGKKNLQSKAVSVRGKVVKYNEQIMGKNWVHLQDGTGAAGSNDLTLTTADTAKVGDTVLVKGTVALDKDFGYNYKYAVMLENAKVTVEAPAKP
jgi:hypothetical protein